MAVLFLSTFLKIAVYILTSLACVGLEAQQVVFKTIVPQQPVVLGESFRVQYVAEGAETMDHFVPPSFTAFRVVDGPEVYSGLTSFTSKGRQLRNTIYTLEATSLGRKKIAGAVAGINGKSYRSNDAWVEVITAEQADLLRRENGLGSENSPYFLQPGEDPSEKIRQNLFLKVFLNKMVCYPGEPIVATFKLYSRLESKSEISKNPGFYGFTVHDMIGLNDKVNVAEAIGGKFFDVHTVRQVQLYALQPGSFIIDPMEINNRVEFSRSYVSKKTEQEIAEAGALANEEGQTPGTSIFEASVRTEPVTIVVKPVPARNKPGNFNGATGRFTISVAIEKNELARNEEGHLVLTIRGKGNFSQLSSPNIQWPTGIDGFDPVVSESIERSVAPLKGQKIFRYPFVSSKPGSYELPAIKFSFFDPDTNSYKTVAVSPGKILILNKEKATPTLTPATKKKSITEINRKASRIAASIVAVLVFGVLLFWFTRRKPPVKNIEPVGETQPSIYPSANEVLQPAILQLKSPGKEFYVNLYHSLWSHLGQLFGLSGTQLNKRTLMTKLNEVGFKKPDELLRVLQQCEAGMFTDALLEDNREELLEQARQLVEELKPGHSAYL